MMFLFLAQTQHHIPIYCHPKLDLGSVPSFSPHLNIARPRT